MKTKYKVLEIQSNLTKEDSTGKGIILKDKTVYIHYLQEGRGAIIEDCSDQGMGIRTSTVKKITIDGKYLTMYTKNTIYLFKELDGLQEQ